MTLGYLDSLHNLYLIEQASSGKLIVIRASAGGNRKRFRLLGEYDDLKTAQDELSAYAKENGWAPYESNIRLQAG